MNDNTQETVVVVDPVTGLPIKREGEATQAETETEGNDSPDAA